MELRPDLCYTFGILFAERNAMRGRKSALVVVLSDAETQRLQAWCRATTTPVGLVRRAQAILAVAEGQPLCRAAQRAGLSENHTRKWVGRFLVGRIHGLAD